MFATRTRSLRGAFVLIGSLTVACSKRESPTVQSSNTLAAVPEDVAAPSPSVVASSAPDASKVQTSATWCWKSLPAPFAHEDLSVMVMDFSLASTGKTVWLGYSGGGSFLSSYEAGVWTPGPIAKSTATSYVYPALASTSSGTWLAWSDTGGRQSQVYAAKRSGNAWVPIGGEIGAYPDDFTNAGDQALAVDTAGNPSIVWTEAKPGSGGGAPKSLHVARWNGTAWLSLGALGTDDYADPSIAIDSSGAPWIAWVHGGLHVARHSGTAWIEAPVPAGLGGRAPHIVIEPGDVAFVSWTMAGIAAARTNGSDWNMVTPPSSNRVLYTALQLIDGTPTIAWSDGDRGELASAQVARFVGGRWVDVFRGMQVDTGQSDVFAVALAPSEQGFYLAWDEPGADKIRSRVIEAHPCAAGETPAPIPGSKPLESFWPKTVAEAVTQILSTMDEASKKMVRETPKGDLIKFHLGWGTGIRNEMGLWKGNAALLASCHTTNPEDCSSVIIEKTWERLQTTDAAAP